MSDEQAAELKGCPFCGASVIRDNVTTDVYTVIACTECDRTFDETDEDWNTRPIEDALRAKVSELTRLLGEAEEGIRALAFALAPDGHSVPYDCFATGPSTGDPIRDLLVCPACVAYELKAVKRALKGASS